MQDQEEVRNHPNLIDFSAPQNEGSYSAGAGAGKKKTVTFHTSKVAACSNDDTIIGDGRNESTIDEF